MTLPSGFVLPCLPTETPRPPSGELWVHEIKHDGFRVIARKGGAHVRLYSRPGNDLTDRFPLIVEALGGLRSQSVILDGEAVACDDNGFPSFDRLRRRQHDASVFLYAFDLIESNGDDLRRDPLEVRKATLASVLARASHGLQPADVEDVAEAVARVMQRTEMAGLTFECGGPRVYSYEELLRTIARSANVKPILVPVPFAAWQGLAWIAERLPGAPVTRNQVDLMRIDTVASPDQPGFAALGISPRPMEEVLQNILTTG